MHRKIPRAKYHQKIYGEEDKEKKKKKKTTEIHPVRSSHPQGSRHSTPRSVQSRLQESSHGPNGSSAVLLLTIPPSALLLVMTYLLTFLYM